MYGINICQLSGAFYVPLSIKKKDDRPTTKCYNLGNQRIMI